MSNKKNTAKTISEKDVYKNWSESHITSLNATNGGTNESNDESGDLIELKLMKKGSK